MTQTKPCIALLGEFSAGKSTLANLLLGSDQSTVRVTATRMPPVRYVAGDGPSILMGVDGTEMPLAEAALDDGELAEIREIRIPLQAAILERCDLIDMPGSSDPNMPGDIWGGLLPEVDIALWCTPATQAWRQSEAALWEAVPEALKTRSLLLLTRIDKVDTDVDRKRVLDRIRIETRALFRTILPVSLVQTGHGDDGIAAFRAALDDVLENPEPQVAEVVSLSSAGPKNGAKLSIKPRRVDAGRVVRVTPQPRRVTRRDRLI